MLKRASRPKSVKRGGKKAVRRRQIGADRDLSHIGRKVDQVEVQFGTRLLKHFSEQLYASPNKAFEELISNSWDAGATACHTVISDDLKKEDAMIMVLDNGVSMNKQGLHDLWKIAWSRKRDQGPVDGRNPIGKFGIGKLATYALATKLTYVCMAEDGIIRAVTMDYDDFERKQPRSKKVAFRGGVASSTEEASVRHRSRQHRAPPHHAAPNPRRNRPRPRIARNQCLPGAAS